ncbi:methyltransferase domain-containing protein [Primorskyibacter sp. 2E107]|uniref:class I SAM-dependent methyltransferase n=1 Tax=Primorskyibacter sp. 2E107 TaxID=3403458 RepID=UPI003AF46EB9
MDWKAFYDARVAELDPGAHLAQVGHTVNGKPIPTEHFNALLAQIAAELDIRPDDHLLDLCCGNGVFTRPLAEPAKAALGVDISGAMLQVARADHAAPNLSYAEMDVAEIASLSSRPEAPFTRVMMYGAWQHFTPEAGRAILSDVLRIAAPDLRIFLGFVPDVARKDCFFDTPERRAAHAAHVAAGTDAFGTWWEQETLAHLAADLGLVCRFSELPPQVHAAAYRFNATLTRD